ncbi:MAG: hypothetical protein ACK4J3_19265, partial [Acinetobacter pittii]
QKILTSVVGKSLAGFDLSKEIEETVSILTREKYFASGEKKPNRHPKMIVGVILNIIKMKKIVLNFILLFICSSNIYSNESIYFNSNIDIVENIFSDDIRYSMNSPFLYECNVENVSLGWGRWLSIAGADIIGAGTGVWAVKEIGLAAGTFTGGTGTAIVYTVAGVVCGA